MLQQKHYIKNIIQQFEFKNEPILKTLIQSNTYLQLTKHLLNKDKKFIKTILYINIVNLLQYVTDCTRLDIVYTTSQLAKYLNNLDIKHY